MISRLTRLIDQRIINGPEPGTVVCWTGIARYIEPGDAVEQCPLTPLGRATCTNCAIDSVGDLYECIQAIQPAVSNCYPNPRASDVHATECERAFREYLDKEQDAKQSS